MVKITLVWRCEKAYAWIKLDKQLVYFLVHCIYMVVVLSFLFGYCLSN
jgi:hypothetical protein